MRRLLPALLLALTAADACAEAPTMADKRPGAVQTTSSWEDSESWVRGVLVDAVATRDSDHFERNALRVAATVRYESIYDFLALGASRNEFIQGSSSFEINSIVGMVRSVNRATLEGITARLAVADAPRRTVLHGEGTWNIRFSGTTGMELLANRDAVESMPALQQGILSNFVAVSLDHALTERLTVIAMPTYRWFSDGNDQKGFRAWLIHTLVPEHGLSVELKLRGYESSQVSSAYFSPDRYERAEIGLRLRRSFGEWRLYATADAGMERINGDTEKPAGEAMLTARRFFAGGAALGAQLAYFRSSDGAGNLSSSGSYSWRMARVLFTIPF